MNPIQAIATLRKFANYLAGIFPFLAVIADRLAGQIKKLGELPLVKPFLERAGKSSFFLAIWKFFERFYWRDYAKDRMELGVAPAETTPVLRTMIQLCVILSLVIPFSSFQLAPVQIETFSGYKHSAAGWAILLWMISLPCGWASLLIGSAVCNRIAFIVAALGTLYFMSTCVLLLPRSFMNAFLTLAVLFSLVYCERTLNGKDRRSRVMSWLNAIIVGGASGFQFTVLTPLRPWLGTVLQWPAEYISFGLGGTIGVLAGTACLLFANAQPSSNSANVFPNNLTISKAVLIVVLSLLCYMFGTLRGGLAQEGGMIVSSLDLSNAYLWPILYFVGVGIIHKLLGSSKVVASSVRGLMHPWLLLPLLITVLLLATLAVLSEDVCDFLSQQSSAIGVLAFNAYLPIYRATQSVIWHDPLLSMSAHWMTWVLLFDIAIAATLAIHKRLTAGAMSRIFFATCLAALLIWEYVFQLSSFARSPIHSVIMIWLFAVWLLWLMHTIGWNLSLRSSPLWPARGRLAIYGGIVTLIILQVNARAMSHDYRIVNELFLTMFRGVIDVGLPYYLLLWANKRMKEVSPHVGVLLAAFTAGGVTSMFFNAMDKCCSSLGFVEVVKMQLHSLQNTGSINLEVPVNGYWLFLKAAIFVFLLAAVRRIAGKVSAKARSYSDESASLKAVEDNSAVAARWDLLQTEQDRHWMLYLLIAFASGVVSFSYTLVEFPIPPELRVALAPLQQEVTFNCNVLHKYLAFWIPALMVALVALKTANPQKLFWGSVASTLVAGGILFSYENYEVWLRASGALTSIMVLLSAILVALILQILHTLESSGDSGAGTKPGDDALLSYRTSASLAIVAALSFAIFTSFQPGIKVFDERPAPSFKHSIVLAGDWVLKETTPAKAPFPEISTFTRKSQSVVSTLQVMSMESDPAGVRSLLQKWVNFLHLKVTKLDSWDHFYPGALACQFTPPEQAGMPMFAETVLIPLPTGRTEIVTVVTDPSSFDQAIWETAYLVKKLPR